MYIQHLSQMILTFQRVIIVCVTCFHVLMYKNQVTNMLPVELYMHKKHYGTDHPHSKRAVNSVRQDYKRDVRWTVLDDRNEVQSNADISWISTVPLQNCASIQSRPSNHTGALLCMPLFTVLR